MSRAVQKPRWALVGIQAVKSDFHNLKLTTDVL